jgi:hypothetical protein
MRSPSPDFSPLLIFSVWQQLSGSTGCFFEPADVGV